MYNAFVLIQNSNVKCNSNADCIVQNNYVTNMKLKEQRVNSYAMRITTEESLSFYCRVNPIHTWNIVIEETITEVSCV